MRIHLIIEGLLLISGIVWKRRKKVGKARILINCLRILIHVVFMEIIFSLLNGRLYFLIVQSRLGYLVIFCVKLKDFSSNFEKRSFDVSSFFRRDVFILEMFEVRAFKVFDSDRLMNLRWWVIEVNLVILEIKGWIFGSMNGGNAWRKIWGVD